MMAFEKTHCDEPQSDITLEDIARELSDVINDPEIKELEADRLNRLQKQLFWSGSGGE